MKGRKTATQICIHHINGNHEDNRPENKQEMTISQHSKMHYLQGDYPLFNSPKIGGMII